MLKNIARPRLYTVLLDIGLRFRTASITQTVPNVSSNVPWMPKKYWINHCKAHFFIIKHWNVQIQILRMIHNLAPSLIAHCTGNFFSFPKHPLQVKFRSSVQVLWKLLVCIEGVESLQTNNFHKIWTDDRNLTYEGCFGKEKKFPVQWAMCKGTRSWMKQSI